MNNRPYEFHPRGRTLAIDVSPAGYGFVVLEGATTLLDWGTARVHPRLDSRFIARLKAHVEEYKPSLVVLQEPLGRKSARARRRLFLSIEVLGQKDVTVRLVSAAQVTSTFADVTTKHGRAAVIAEWFPALHARLPRPRKPWTAEAEAMNVFDAMAFAITALQSPELPVIRA